MPQLIAGLAVIYLVIVVVHWIFVNIILPFLKGAATIAVVLTVAAVGTGLAIGGFSAIRNYIVSFRNNVKFEKV